MTVPRNSGVERQQTPKERIPIEHGYGKCPDDFQESSLSDPSHDHESSQSVNQAARPNMEGGPPKQPEQKPAGDDDQDDINDQLLRMKRLNCKNQGQEVGESYHLELDVRAQSLLRLNVRC